jgi:ribosomal protein S18 acetylase RimI-like enzyme
MIRPFKPSDTDPLVEAFNLNVPEYFDPKEVYEFIDYLKIKSDTYVTIEHENQIIGGAGCEIRETDRSGRINWIFIHPDFKGTGQGKKAVEYCLSILQSNPSIEVLIIRTSQLAYAFFEPFGYQVTRTEKDYWGQGLDLYVMERKVIK